MEGSFTLLYTDLVDSTALNARLGDGGMAPIWEQHDRGARDLLRLWRGREIDRSDGFAILFENTADAAAFAAGYHRLLAGLPVPLKARAGLHVGMLTLRQNSEADVALGAKPFEVIGLARAVGARLMALAQGGQTLASSEAVAALEGSAWRTLAHGHWRMKGVDEPLAVFEVGDDMSPFVPPPDSEKAQRVLQVDGLWIGLRQVPRQLPAERDAFFGRGDELRALAQLLHDGARLVTLHGAGGIGKTRLALRYGWAWLGSYPGGVWFCDLAPARDLDGLVHAIAQGLDVPLGRDPLGQLGRAIAGHGRCLVIIDNFEHLARLAGDTLGRWLDAAPDARFVATSRELLGLPGERTLALPTLAVGDAVALFHRRALAAHSGYDAARVPAADLQALVELLDGLPLAIELAAARVSVLPPQQLLQRMGDRFRLLAARSGRPDRQATLHATLEWSWEWLAAAERSTLAQLSVFEGGFSGTAAEAVVDLAACDGAPWLIDLVQSLVDKSLVRPLPDGRFTLLRSVQDHAALQLASEGRFPGAGAALVRETQRRHQRFFAALDDGAAMAQRGIELDNLVAAGRRATAAGDAADASALLRAAWGALRLNGPFRLAIALADAVRTMPGLTPAQAATVEWVAASALHTVGSLDAARQAAQAGLALVDARAEPRLAALLNIALGRFAAATGDGAEATQRLEQAQALAVALDDPALHCQVLNTIGEIAYGQGRVDAARASYDAGLAVALAAGDIRWQGGLLGNLGTVHYADGRLDAARDAFERALALTHDSGDRRWEGNTRCNLGLVYQELGRNAEAQTELARALEMARAMGLRLLEDTARCNLGIVLDRSGELARACDHLAAAVASAQTHGDARSEGQYRAYLGSALARAGRIAEARSGLERGIALLLQADDPLHLGLLLCSLGECERLAGDEAAADQAFERARGVIRQQGWTADSELGRRLAQLTRR